MIDGPPVTGSDDRDWAVEYERLLGVAPPTTALKGATFKLTWLRKQFIKDQLTDVQTQQHSRAYILNMIDTTMFPNYSMNKIYLI